MSPANDRMRIGDGEREQAASVLAEHFAQGRLTHSEYAERFDAVWTARTQGDLRTLFHDLPGAARTRTPQRQRHGFHMPGVVWLLLAIIAVVLAIKAFFFLLGVFLPILLIVVVGAIAFKVGRGRRRRRRRSDRSDWIDRL